ncbi:MAG: acyltransferase [Butyrivibrio sp.]|nr:acyltransferase [Butyrivibrio sp.]
MNSTEGITAKKRNANFELLRIVAMFMIITLHYNGYADTLLHLGVPASSVEVYATILESFCIAGLNVYLLISGYFLSGSRMKISRLLQLIAQVYFYTVLISAALMIAGTYSMYAGNSLYKTIQYMFPISSEHYWFVTAYVIMYALSPVMNAAIEKLSRKQMKTVILLLLLWFCFIKSFVPVMFVTDKAGYDYGWFICLYLIAAYIRKYDVKMFYNAKNSAVVFLVSGAVNTALSLLLHYINLKRGGFIYYSQVPTHYNFFFTLMGSLGLFSFFRYYRVKENKIADVIRFVGPLTFGVYLLHMHIEIRDRWIEWIGHIIGEVPLYSIPGYALHLAASIIIIFAAGIFVDFIRKTVFDFVGRVLHDTWLFKKIREWDESLC